MLGFHGIKMVATDNFEMSTYRLSSDYSASELRGYIGGSGEIRTHGPISKTSVFKTGAINQTLPRFRKTKLEHRVRFELTVLRICNPLHWATLPPVHYMEDRRGIEPLFSG
jgi:hypothetical protein